MNEKKRLSMRVLISTYFGGQFGRLDKGDRDVMNENTVFSSQEIYSIQLITHFIHNRRLTSFEG